MLTIKTPSGRLVRTTSMPTSVLHPNPLVQLAQRPALPRMSGEWVMTNLRAPSLLTAVNKFLEGYCPPGRRSFEVNEHDLFDVWTRFRLKHAYDPVGGLNERVTEVIRAWPDKYNARGNLRARGIFDTVLVADDLEASGIQSECSYAFCLYTL